MDPSEVVERAFSHVSEKLWSNYTKSDYTIEQWHAACLIHLHDGPPTSKSQCKLPVKTPNGALNRNGVHAAAAALAGARSPLKASPEQKTKAASALRRYYSQLGETPPDSLKQSALNAVGEVLTHQGSNTNSLVIVAIPKEDDYVNRISSEKVPHMTLLFLGEDVSQVKNLAKIMDFTKHAADTSLKRFSLEVDRREVLGPDEADTLVFSKARWSGFNEINDYRSYLLKDDNIRIAYESATQFPEWIPHITLGYPETPANPDNRDYPGIRYVEFDKIAVWFGDYEGVEFPLKVYDWELDMAMSTSEIVERVLSHHGVMGMKWGRRKGTSGPQAVVVSDKRKGFKTSGGQGHPAHPDAIRSRKTSQVVKKSGTKALSDQELNDFVRRIDLEQRAKRAQFSTKNPAQKFVAKILGQTGKNTVQNAANDVAAQQVRKHLVKASLLAL